MYENLQWSRSSSGPGQTSVVSLVSPPSDAAVEVKSSSLISLTSLICVVSSPAGQTNITAEPGHDVSLPCRAGHDGDIDAVEWTRPDLDPEYVLSYRGGSLDLENQHQSFQNRVDLQDRQMKDGDVSLILKKVTTNDTGTYECRVFQRRTGSMIAESKSIIIHLEVSPPGQTNITAEPGHDVSLPCRAGHDGDIDAVEWTRPDLDPQYVLSYRGGSLDPDHQHPSFQNRVDLQDRQMKDGDVSLILKKVTTDDTGTYECRVFQRRTGSRIAESKSIIIHLEVSPPATTQDGRNQDGGDKDGGDKDRGDKEGGDKVGGDKDGGHYGLIVGLSAVVIVGMIVGFWIYKRVQKKNWAPLPELL
ncbi:immunoglobulin superfamily member 2-like [Melanotaenia boesemani]|uniref:immunoglobulin superfamily member 2-like n=1 Tax=Melanotaenia boesemani TaxID=1250792 RepID=UPI001C0442AF|nr:immunoglobulin superfamily member 2-like [Melanotaenia boesemani]